MKAVARDYEEPNDIALLQEVASECWRLEAPFAPFALGDPAWWMYQHLNKLDEVRVRLWLDERTGRPLGWAWLSLPAELDFVLHPDVRGELVDDVLDWFEREASGDERAVWALERDRDAVSAIERRGYVRDLDRWLEHMVRSLDDPPPEPDVPAGYRLRTVRGDEDVEARVDVHRAAFAPSRVVPESYRNVMRAHPYKRELDYVVEAPDGSFAAFCLCWLDERNAVGEFEPVGTHPDHRRRGLARAVCLAGLRALRERGARTAVVYSVGGSPATALYESLGFESISRHAKFRKPALEGKLELNRSTG